MQPKGPAQARPPPAPSSGAEACVLQVGEGSCSLHRVHILHSKWLIKSILSVPLGASLVASAVGLGVATAGGAVTVASDLSLIVCSSREAQRVQEIAAACQDQMREVLGFLDFFCRWQGRGDRRLLRSGRLAAMALCGAVCAVVCFGSRGFLPPARAEGAARVSQAVLRAKVQKLAESLESCTGALDRLGEQLEAAARLRAGPRRGRDLKGSADRPSALCF